MEKEDIEVRIREVIDELRPFLISDGGNLEYIGFEDGVVTVRLTGACASCSMMDITLKDGIEQILMNEIKEVKEVRNID